MHLAVVTGRGFERLETDGVDVLEAGPKGDEACAGSAHKLRAANFGVAACEEMS